MLNWDLKGEKGLTTRRTRGGTIQEEEIEVQKVFGGGNRARNVQGIEGWHEWLEQWVQRVTLDEMNLWGMRVPLLIWLFVSYVHKIEFILLLSLLYPIIAGLWLLSFKFLNILLSYFIFHFQSNFPTSHILPFLCIYPLCIFFHSTFHTSICINISMFVVF